MKRNQLHPQNRQYRLAGITMAISTSLGLLAVSMHPSVGKAQSPDAILNQIAAFAMHDELVHFALIVLLAVIAGCFSVFGDLLDAQRRSVRFGKVAYFFGYGALTAAMLFDGFVIPIFGRQFVGANTADMQTALLVLQAIGVVVQVLTKAGMAATGMAFIVWAFALHSCAKPFKSAVTYAWVGYAAGIIPISIIVFMGMTLGPHNLAIIFALQAVWNLCVAALLLQTAASQS